jgi:hypothetical protein
MPAVRVLGAVGGIVLAVLLAGCSGGSAGHPGHSASGTAAATATGHASAQPTCALVPASLVNTALGSDVGAPAQTLNGSVTVCEYNGAKAGHVIVRFQTGEDAASFATGREGFDSNGEPTKTVTGFADEAYSSTLGAGDLAVVTLVARTGPVEILVTSSASLDAEKALERQLFARL